MAQAQLLILADDAEDAWGERMVLHLPKAGLQRDGHIIGQGLAHQVLGLIQLQAIGVLALGPDPEPPQLTGHHVLADGEHVAHRCVDVVADGGPLVHRGAGDDGAMERVQIRIYRGAAGEGVPEQMGHDRAHVDDGAAGKAPHGLLLEVGNIVAKPPAVHILAAVEVHHVKAAVVEDVGDALGDLVLQVGLLVDDVAVDAAIDAVVVGRS